MSSKFVVANATTAVMMTTINSYMSYSGYCILQSTLDRAFIRLGENPSFHLTRSCQPQEIPHNSIVTNSKNQLVKKL